MNQDKQNVIIVCDYAHTVGGAEKVAIESAIGLKKLGVNVIFFSAVGPVDMRLRESGVNVICLNQSDVKSGNKVKALFQILWNYKAQKAFRTVLRGLSRDNTVIHAHIWQKSLSSSIFYETYKQKYPVVFTMHHYFLACPNGGFYNYKKNEICYLNPLCKKCLITQCDKDSYVIKIFRYIRSIIERKICKVPNQIKYYITISDLGRKVMQPYLPKDSKYYPIDNPFSMIKTKKVNVIENNIYIYIGRLSAEKGVVILAQLAEDLGIKLVIIGDGPERANMEKISQNLIFSGWLSQEEVENYITKARAFIFPTLWYEGMPMSVLECSAYGVPTILPDTCSATEIIKDNYTGFVYKQGDYEDLKRCVRQSLDNEILEKISLNVYQYFHSKDYSTQRHCRDLITLYKKIIDSENL
ncbi:glycosyltransferase family 4 protein [Turicibacter sanguinis]|uniref:glycosyltransferase family 4 protein n=1 Tax=Turicibacter sanguinis TaxID=154288 RepID=UPI0018AB76C1|nr:glycosyltransferase family 4 protein [Turicibacter sanguinis]MDB8553977.1 glycosyltransferase family 4 protein [Turicibacter sanguinis]